MAARPTRPLSSSRSRSSHLLWDESSRSIRFGEPARLRAAVPAQHNCVANGILGTPSEQDADVVLFIYRDESSTPESEPSGMSEIIGGAKHRMGPPATRDGLWGAVHKFENLAVYRRRVRRSFTVRSKTAVRRP